MERVYVAVVGSGEAEDSVLDVAFEVGRELALRGAVVVSGGLGGAMEAASRGAASAYGTTIGILPGLDRAEANPHVDFAIPTGMGELRNGLIVRAADAVVAVAGEFGTLSEVAFALKTGVPVVGIDTWRLARSSGEVDAIERATGAVEAATRAVELARRRSSR